MISMHDFQTGTEIFLVEGAKVIVVLVLGLLSGRLWAFGRKAGSPVGRSFLAAAAFFAGMTVLVGYVGVRHSLGKLYLHFGEVAMEEEGNLAGAANLFALADSHWSSARTKGKLGVALLLLNQEGPGRQLLRKAQALRGYNSPFEQFFEGLCFFLQGNLQQAIPLLEAASDHHFYRIRVVKIFCIIQIDQGDMARVKELFQPYEALPVDGSDHALIRIALHLHQKEPEAARALFRKHYRPDLPPMWRSRFQKLGERYGLLP